MYTKTIHQRRSDSACITKVPLPPVRSQAGAGHFVAPGMGISDTSGMQTATCASTFPAMKPHKLTLQYVFEGTESVLTPLIIARSLEFLFPDDKSISVSQNRANKSLMIEVDENATYNALLDTKEINRSPVEITPRETVLSKGIFHCEETLDLTDREQGQLKRQGVIELHRINHTHMYFVTFSTHYLPKEIKISSLVFKIKLHVPKPRR